MMYSNAWEVVSGTISPPEFPTHNPTHNFDMVLYDLRCVWQSRVSSKLFCHGKGPRVRSLVVPAILLNELD